MSVFEHLAGLRLADCTLSVMGGICLEPDQVDLTEVNVRMDWAWQGRAENEEGAVAKSGTKEAPRVALMGAFGPWAEAGAAWSEALAELGSEMLHFVAERVQEDVAVQQRLIGAANLEEVRHIQAEFVQKAIDQYAAETGRIVEMSGELAGRLGVPRNG
jgi:hypothetical protein